MSGIFTKDLGTSLLANPLNIQLVALEELETRLNGEYYIADPNTPFNFLLEMASDMTAAGVLSSEKAFNSLYAKRAQTSEDLYKHMSDYDYVGLFSSPGSMQIRMDFDRAYLYEKAKNFNDNYKKVVIPQETTFIFGKYNFGLYYPIEIRFNRHVESIIANYNTNEINPLYKLDTNVLDKREYEYSGIKFLSIKFPIFQFTTNNLPEVDLIAGAGFSKTYKYTDKFYSFRAYHYFPNTGEWKELAQSISEEIYDPNIPTIRFKIYSENNEIMFNIPSIYFSNNLMGSKLAITLYTTLGNVDLNLSKISNPKVNFAFNSSDTTEFSYVLKNIPTCIIAPITGMVSGGSDGYSYEALRNNVINDGFYPDVLVRAVELENYLKSSGFKITKYLDNITDRIYFCFKTLTDDKGDIVQTVNSMVSIFDSMLKDISSMIKNMDGTITILPTTIYEYNDNTQSCIPLTDNERLVLSQKSKIDLIEDVNTHSYVKSPFHIHVINDERYPRATSYNLLSPNVTDIYFEKENIEISSQMVMHTASITHQNDGTGGYRLIIAVSKSKDLEKVPMDDFTVYAFTTNLNNTFCGLKGKYIGDLDGQNVFEFLFDTTYAIKETGHINMTNMISETPIWENFINLESEFIVAFLVKQSHVPAVTNTSNLNMGIPEEYRENMVVMARQTMTVHFGHSLNDVIFNKVDKRYINEKYETYEMDIFQTYKEDIPKRDENGSIIIEIIDGKPEVIIEHAKGETVLDDQNNPRILHKKGDIKLDAYGNPILSETRQSMWDVDLIQVDYRQFISEHPTQLKYKSNIIQNFEKYFDSIKAVAPSLIEQTKIYFRPIKTMGVATFGIGDGAELRRSLSIVFNLKAYVPNYVYKDTDLQNSIRDSIIDIIEENITQVNINMADLVKIIKNKLSEYLYHLDILGIDDDVDLQTLLVIDNDCQPSIAQEMYLTNDDTIALRKRINIQFVTE